MPNNRSKMDELMENGLLLKGSDPSLVVNRLPLGIPSLDAMLGGGLPLGRCIQSYGPESTGKTLLSQYAVAAVQKSAHPLALYMDMERSFDEPWWQQSGVDTDKLLVSTPMTCEQATDIMRTMLENSTELGIIIIDSIAAMSPQVEVDPERASTENKIPGAQAKSVTTMYRQIIPLLTNHVIVMSTNQMRENIGLADELSMLPGGRANRHYNHIILRTRREGWITDTTTKNRLGFYMEITQKKNKLAKTPDGTSITLPFMYNSQIDWTVTYIEEGIEKGFIIKSGPYFKTAGQSFLGKPNLRQFFSENPAELEILKTNIGL